MPILRHPLLRYVLFIGTFFGAFDSPAQTFNAFTDQSEWIKTKLTIRRWIASDSIQNGVDSPMDILYVNTGPIPFRVDSASSYLKHSYRQSPLLPMDGNLNFRFYMVQHNTAIYNKNQWVVNPYFNPFNWARFVKETKANRKQP